MKFKRIMVLSSFIAISTILINPALAQVQSIDIGDITSFGVSLAGKQVRYKGIIINAYACQLPSNRGNQCLVVRDVANKNEEAVIVPNGAYSISEYKKWMSEQTLLTFTGTVEMRDGSNPTYKENTLSPILIGQKITLAN
jgi:hypothetical protein